MSEHVTGTWYKHHTVGDKKNTINEEYYSSKEIGYRTLNSN